MWDKILAYEVLKKISIIIFFAPHHCQGHRCEQWHFEQPRLHHHCCGCEKCCCGQWQCHCWRSFGLESHFLGWLTWSCCRFSHEFSVKKKKYGIYFLTLYFSHKYISNITSIMNSAFYICTYVQFVLELGKNIYVNIRYFVCIFRTQLHLNSMALKLFTHLIWYIRKRRSRKSKIIYLTLTVTFISFHMHFCHTWTLLLSNCNWSDPLPSHSYTAVLYSSYSTG